MCARRLVPKTSGDSPRWACHSPLAGSVVVVFVVFIIFVVIVIIFVVIFIIFVVIFIIFVVIVVVVVVPIAASPKVFVATRASRARTSRRGDRTTTMRRRLSTSTSTSTSTTPKTTTTTEEDVYHTPHESPRSNARDALDDDEGVEFREGMKRTKSSRSATENDDEKVIEKEKMKQRTMRARLASMRSPTLGRQARLEAEREAEERRKLNALLLTSTKSFRAVKSRSLEVYCATWNVGNKAPTIDAATGWLMDARERADIIAIGAQEASYSRSSKNVKPATVAKCVGDEEPYESKVTKRGFWQSSKWTKAGMMAGGMFAGGLLAVPIGAAPGMLCGLFAGYFAGKRVVDELKVRTHWFEFLIASLGKDFVLLQSEVLMQMRLTVFIRAKLQSRVRSVKVGSKATGLGNLVGNKGGLIVHVEFDNGETIAFVSCHLAAHEGEKYFEARNDMVSEIICKAWLDCGARTICAPPVLSDVNSAFFDASNEIMSKVTRTKHRIDAWQNTGKSVTFATQKNQAVDLLNGTTHVFFMGDLNYRLDPGMLIGNEWNTHWGKGRPEPKVSVREMRPPVEKVPLSKYPAARPVAQPGMVIEDEEIEELIYEESPFMLGRRAVLEHVQGRKFETLEKADQLKHAMKQGKIFAGFREMPLRFYPTFKRRGSLQEKKGGLKCSSSDTVSSNVVVPIPGSAEYYNEKRVPSWCDRVLVHSLPGAETSCEQIEYDARHDVPTSDHAPVYAIHRVTLRQLPAVNSLPRGKLTFTGLQITREFSEAEYVSNNTWVHVLVPHTRIVLPEASELSSTHTQCVKSDEPTKLTARYEWSADSLPRVVVGFHESDKDILDLQKKKAEKSTRQSSKSSVESKVEKDADEMNSAADVMLGVEAYGQFQAIITLMDSRLGTKLGTAAIALSNTSFDVPLELYSQTVGRVVGAWSIEAP